MGVEVEEYNVSEWIKDSGWTKVTKQVSADTTMWTGMLCPDCSEEE